MLEFLAESVSLVHIQADPSSAMTVSCFVPVCCSVGNCIVRLAGKSARRCGGASDGDCRSQDEEEKRPGLAIASCEGVET